MRWAATVILALAAAFPAAAKTPATLGPLRVQLYYKTSGTLSANIAPPAKFSGWNTGAGEGDAKEPAEDLVISVPIRPGAGWDAGENSELPLTITARGKAGKVLGSRTFRFVSIPYKDPVWSPLWLSGVQCAGLVRITATWGKQTQTTQVSLDCGE